MSQQGGLIVEPMDGRRQIRFKSVILIGALTKYRSPCRIWYHIFFAPCMLSFPRWIPISWPTFKARLNVNHARLRFPQLMWYIPCRSRHSRPSIVLTTSSSEVMRDWTVDIYLSILWSSEGPSWSFDVSKPPGSCCEHTARYNKLFAMTVGWSFETSAKLYVDDITVIEVLPSQMSPWFSANAYSRR